MKNYPLHSGTRFKELTKLYLDIPNIREATVIEIGCLYGASSMIATSIVKKLYCIDLWFKPHYGIEDNEYGPEEEFDKNMKTFKNMEKLKGPSRDYKDHFGKESIDVVYIDGDHSFDAVVEDIKNYYPLIKVGGWITGHDYCDNHSSVVDAVNELLRVPDKRYEDSSWAIQKKEGQS